MLSNGYSQAQMERALKSLGLPFSKEALEDALALIQEKLSFYKTQPLVCHLHRWLLCQVADRGGETPGDHPVCGGGDRP